MSGFDGELYLRLAGERWLQASGGDWSGLTDRARALVAVGRLSVEAAEDVVGDYALAEVIRSQGPWSLWANPASPRPPSDYEIDMGVRIARCDRVLQRPWGQIQIRYVSLGADETRLSAAMRQNEAWRDRSTQPFAAPWGSHDASPIVLTDDRGTASTATFGEFSGTATLWAGTWRPEQPLAPDTRWLEYDGERLDLAEPLTDITIELVQVEVEDPAHRHLWARVAELVDDTYDSAPLDVTVEALQACGALDAGDPTVADALAVVVASPWNRARRQMLLRLDLSAGPEPTGRPLPEPWGSMLQAREDRTGSAGLLVLDTGALRMDEMTVRVVAVESTPETFLVDVLTSGWPMDPNSARRWGLGARRLPLTWWARDDRGNHYLGHLTPDHALGLPGWRQVEFHPALDPDAAQLNLILTGEATRAVIGIPLRWDAQS